MAKEKFKPIDIKNRKATHEYEFLSTYEAGIVLSGTEVKAVRAGYANLNDAFCHFIGGELFIRNNGLQHKKSTWFYPVMYKVKIRLTIVPYRIYTTERGFIKIEIALAQGKKSYDKRETLKERDSKRDLDRIKKAYK